MENNTISQAIETLSREFSSLDLSFHPISQSQPHNVTSYFPGKTDEDVIVCVFKGPYIHEPFHRQDFFFINYAYLNSYQALSERFNHLITIHQGDIYIGQPYSGYALRADGQTTTIIGILIRKDVFFHQYLPSVSSDGDLFRFFLSPRQNKYSDEYIHLETKAPIIRNLIEMMIMEYANRKEDTQPILKSMLQTLLLEIARYYHQVKGFKTKQSLSEQIVEYMNDHPEITSLKDIADHFGYHPNYVSALLHKETGHHFTEILREKRMNRAILLMENTDLSLEEISSLIGYANHSNFYKAFKVQFHMTPRDYMKAHKK